MRSGFHPYPQYKDSGAYWLGDIPTHWALSPLFTEYKKKFVKNINLIEQQVLALSYGRIMLKPQDKLYRLAPASFETHQIIEPNDLILRPTDLWYDRASLRTGLSMYHGIISPAYMCLQTCNQLSAEYGYYVLTVFDLTKEVYRYGSGVRQNLSFDDIRRVTVLIPPPNEQQAIVHFLTKVSRYIQHYIWGKQRLIELLNEQKRLLIRKMVTQGIDPYVQMKNSGAEWFEKLPAHWEIRKIAHIARVFSGITPGCSQPVYWNNGTIPWISSGKVKDFIIREPSEYITERGLKESALQIVPRGSVVIALGGQGKTRGKSAYLEIDTCINQGLAAVIPEADFSGRYILYLLTAFYSQIREYRQSSSPAVLKTDIISSLRLPFPELSEQNAIVSYLEDMLKDFNIALKKIEKEIALMQAYRSRLIIDVTTGKIDVRELAFKIPESFDESDLTDEDFEDEEDLDGLGFAKTIEAND